MQFRELTKEEFKDLLDIAFRSFYRGAIKLLFTPEEHFVQTFNSLSLAFEQPDLCMIGVEERGKIVGAILGYGDERKHIYHCSFLWVSKDLRNRQIGSRLAQVLLAQAEGLGYANFVVEADAASSAVKRILKGMNFHQAKIVWVRAKV